MRPIKLIMQAFGAYAGKETIDFTELQQEQIFIISGKTGAGKSTIFDAISFAIFGKNNTSDRDGLSMRSHYASSDELTEVSLTFKLGTRNFRIERTPQQEVAKKNGSGMRTINQKAVLYELLVAEEKLLASSVRDVDKRISELMQLTVDQFRQILMIPQGEFRELLTSDSKEKEAILQRLAHTYVYKRIEERLGEKEKTLAADIQQQRQAVYLLAENGLDNGELVAGMTLEAIIDTFQTEIKTKETAQIEQELALRKARMDADEAAEKWTLAKSLQTDFANLEKYRAELASFEEKQPAIDQQKQQLKRARQALQLQAQDSRCQQLKARLTKRETELGTLETELNVAIKELDVLRKTAAEHAAQAEEIESMRKMSYQLESLMPKIERWQQLNSEAEDEQLAELEKTRAAAAEEMSELESKLAALQTQKEALYEAERQQWQHNSELARLESDLEKLRERKEQAAKWQKYQTDLTRLKAEILANQQQAEPLRAEIAALEAKQIHEQAAVLAAQLASGEACPVCGSHEHPQLAVFEDAADETALANAISAEQQLSVQRDELQVQKQQLSWQLDQLAQAESYDRTELEAQLAQQERVRVQLSKTIAETEKELEQLEQITAQQAETETAKQKLEAAIKAQQEAYETLKQQAEKRTAERQFLAAEIPSEYQKGDRFTSQLQQLQNKLAAYDQQAANIQEQLAQITDEVSRKDAAKESVKQDLSHTEAELETERTVFKQLLKEQEFATYDAYRRAVQTTEQMEKLERQLQAFRNDFEIAKSRYQDLAAKLADKTYPDLDDLAQRRQEKQQWREQLEEQTIKLRDRLATQQAAFQRFAKEQKQIAAEEKMYAELGFLANTARGKNDRKLTFERYVLGAFLDTILERANLRLAKMTGGRFQLSRKLERAKGNAQSGLELEVYDAYTGFMRHVRTLSGGESFKTSLALALSLAEVVQEMAGGISLETMFIDEGFGTLDPESLEMAVECLLETQESGRLVGIISHVPELKERIPVRLEVTATNHGSQTRFVHTM